MAVDFQINSKFRRETSNFVIKFNVSEDDMGDSILLKKLQPGLSPEDFIGLCVYLKVDGASAEDLDDEVQMITSVIVKKDQETNNPYAYVVTDIGFSDMYYIVDTGEFYLGSYPDGE